MPTRGTPNCLKTPWAAILEVKCRDVPHLMREGFFWSAENVLPEEGYLSPESRPEWTALGCRHKRTWILADQSDNGQGQRRDPQWVGRLEVVSPVPEALPGFRVQELSRSNVYSAAAWNAREQLVYRYDYRSPSQNCNCIYDDKPLKGWWPWPRDDGVYAAFPHVDDLFPLAPDSCSAWESEFESESEFEDEPW
ncbi:hypothetical protein NEMBOFW57_010180 [Staphylotrichum longicolle]|uniref:Uncharacterized protein n=1 Tax=Staphylotrichum longicolle TaxID=669026 RepID=A0AAD4EQ98_9PEZI|nr:hypothetical protein NEMBOFW57_010180 [Staphylotrichum longicolle]